MPSFALSLVAAAVLAASGWEPLADPALGVEVLRPAGWQVEALANDALVVRAPPPLGGQTTVIALRGAGITGRALVAEAARLLGAEPGGELETSTGHAALVRYVDPAAPQAKRTALIVAAVAGDRALLAIMSAPEGEFAAARPALLAIARHLKLREPKPPALESPAAPGTLAFEAFQEPTERAFVGELPKDWKKELSVAIVQGEQPYVRASVVGRSPERRFAFAHYKLAAFQEPAADAAAAAGSRPYEAGALALENYLFPKVVEKSPGEFAGWSITRRGGVKPLFTHESGVRLDGEQVEYEYRFRGQLLRGGAFVVTYRLPTKPAATWFLYGLFGWEAPAGQESAASQAALRLLRTFSFEGRYAPQADLFWTFARDGAIEAISALAPKPAVPAAPPVIARKSPEAPLDAVERVALGLTGLPAQAALPAVRLESGVARVTEGGQPPPAIDTAALEQLR
jgi:hypothetical protein